jgi:hypothetical protein
MPVRFQEEVQKVSRGLVPRIGAHVIHDAKLVRGRIFSRSGLPGGAAWLRFRQQRCGMLERYETAVVDCRPRVLGMCRSKDRLSNTLSERVSFQ